MSDLLKLPLEYSEETLYVKRMKETIVANQERQGDRICFTFKISRQRHGELLAAVAKHGMTITDLLTLHIDQIVPILQKANKEGTDVPAYKKDLRTKPPRSKWRRVS